MQRILFAAVGCLLLAGCGNGNEATATNADSDTPQAPASHTQASSHGKFTGSVGDQTYEVDVDCFHLDKDWFTFLSDQDDVSDSNGDGQNISGMQNGDKFVFTVVDHGKTYSTGNLTSFSKSATGASGSGTLWLDGASGQFEAEFSVDCK
ncbi:MAG: hypothetical protein PVI46_14590 [Lysobacterales bacterium]|jgi:outer membrane biogenesis lipoprotein LolB